MRVWEGVGRGVSGQTLVFIYTLVKPNKRVAGRDSQFTGFGFTKLLKNNFFGNFFKTIGICKTF